MNETVIDITIPEGRVRWVPPKGEHPGKWVFTKKNGRWAPLSALPRRIRKQFEGDKT